MVGFLNFAVSYSVFLLLCRYLPFSSIIRLLPETAEVLVSGSMKTFGVLSVDASFANAAGYLAGMLNSFILNRGWTFGSRGGKGGEAAKFVVTNFLMLAASSGIIYFLADLRGWPYQPVWFATMAVVTLLNYLLCRHWVFGRG